MKHTFMEKQDLLLIAVICIAFLITLSISFSDKSSNAGSIEDIAERTRTVGTVVVASANDNAIVSGTTTQQPAITGQQESKQTVAVGANVVKKSCSSCHQSGLMGAPAIGDAAAWQGRLDAGFDVLVGHAINGFKAMPARGGNPALKDAEVEQAILFMLEESGISVPGKELITQVVNDSAAEVKDQKTTPVKVASQTKTVAVGANVVKKSCSSCHQSGLMGAPAIGDAAAWQGRLDAGFDVLVGHAINGFKAMPARGGNPALKDAEVEQAVLFMLQESGISVPGKELITQVVNDSAAEVKQQDDNAELNDVTVTASEPVKNKVVVKKKKQSTPPKPHPGKALYNDNCANCHDEGSKSAPVTGKQEVWLPLFSKGIESLTKQVMNGPPVHPGVDVTDVQLTDALDYIMERTFWPGKK